MFAFFKGNFGYHVDDRCKTGQETEEPWPKAGLWRKVYKSQDILEIRSKDLMVA